MFLVGGSDTTSKNGMIEHPRKLLSIQAPTANNELHNVLPSGRVCFLTFRFTLRWRVLDLSSDASVLYSSSWTLSRSGITAPVVVYLTKPGLYFSKQPATQDATEDRNTKPEGYKVKIPCQAQDGSNARKAESGKKAERDSTVPGKNVANDDSQTGSDEGSNACTPHSQPTEPKACQYHPEPLSNNKRWRGCRTVRRNGKIYVYGIKDDRGEESYTDKGEQNACPVHKSRTFLKQEQKTDTQEYAGCYKDKHEESSRAG
jgi:ribosomal protein L36